MTAEASLTGFGAVVVAAGRGERFGTPKHGLTIGGRELWRIGRDLMVGLGADEVIVVGDVPGGVPGGERRRDSVAAGLHALGAHEWVLVHDAARPLATEDVVSRVASRLRAGDVDGVVPAVTLSDTVKRVDDRGVVTVTVDRSNLVAVQTPQAFVTARLVEAHEHGPDIDVTDDAGLVERMGGTVATVPGDADNLKVTYPGDLERARAIWEGRAREDA